ncbi:MAG: hypothetical protein AAGE94_10265, partial [Acidobacteriota bacterium]
FFLLTAAHAVGRLGAIGARLMAAMLLLGLARENLVAVRDWLYGFAELHLALGAAPMIAAIIWGYSIYVALCWAEGITATPWVIDGRVVQPSARALAAVGIFMVALVGFYEPLLDRVGMAKWEAGTRSTAGVPWIALIGYPSLSVPFVVGWASIERRWTGSRRLIALTGWVVALAGLHAWGLQAVKDLLGW